MLRTNYKYTILSKLDITVIEHFRPVSAAVLAFVLHGPLFLALFTLFSRFREHSVTVKLGAGFIELAHRIGTADRTSL